MKRFLAGLHADDFNDHHIDEWKVLGKEDMIWMSATKPRLVLIVFSASS
jgi:hypothetical protein